MRAQVCAIVHTQFDPVANREGSAGSRFDPQLVPVIADLWAAGYATFWRGWIT
jgi:hypothetical protein